MVNGRGAIKILTDKFTGKYPIGGSRLRWEDNIGNNLKEIVVYTRNCIDPPEDRESPRECGIEPKGFGNHGVIS